MTFAVPSGIVALAALLHSWSQLGATVTVLPPDDSNTTNYLARSHFAQFLDFVGFPHTFPSVRERNLGSSIVPLTRMASSADANALASAVVDFAERHNPIAADTLGQAICEAGENVGFHSNQPYGFGLAQYYPASRRFEFALGDAGRGLLGSLSARGATDDATAITMALTPGVSASSEVGRGYGLSSVEEQIVLGLSGTLSLMSGIGLVDAHPAVGRVTRPVVGEYAGTLVFGSFQVPR